ncbi:MAG: TIGR03986 family CRISPR-associated RAMP protein, partial [Cyanobacteria bacterium P01_A01_bin.17]
PLRQNPVIPGSSLRGMMRTLVEIITFSKLESVSGEEHFFFRAVAAPKDDPLANEYKTKINPKTVKAGYLVRRRESWYVRPALDVDGNSFVWIQDTKVCSSFRNFISLRDNAYLPQYIEDISFEDIYVKNTRPLAGFVSNDPNTYQYLGELLTSGNMAESGADARQTRRKNHCLVRQADQKALLIKISNHAIQDYCSALTSFQKECPFDSEKGVLAEGRCIFYCQPKSGEPVTLFGHNPNFRMPYIPNVPGREKRAASALDFLPETLRNPDTIDLADAIFGFVKAEKQHNYQQQARAGRICFSDGVCKQATDEDIWLAEQSIVPKILSGPKPTTFQHYLVQDSVEKPELKHYASKPETETVIRGHKLYWHQGQSPAVQLTDTSQVSDTQTTKIKPIQPGVEFEFTIHFDNLSTIELGALLWILDIAQQEETYRLSLGMGKPLGMGAIKIAHQLYVSNRQQRYQSLFAANAWQTAEAMVQVDEINRIMAAFEKYILEQISEAELPPRRKVKELKEVPRIKMLLAMLTWQETLSPSEWNQRRYMEIERDRRERHVIGSPVQARDSNVNEYRDRPVLPTPIQLMGWDYNPSSNQSNLEEGSIVEAKVIDLSTKVISQGRRQKTRTTVSYAVDGEPLTKTEDIFNMEKKGIALAIGDLVQLEVVEVRDGLIRKFKRVEERASEG